MQGDVHRLYANAVLFYTRNKQLSLLAPSRNPRNNLLLNLRDLYFAFPCEENNIIFKLPFTILIFHHVTFQIFIQIKAFSSVILGDSSLMVYK